MKYPFDHPIRASLIGGVSRQVLDDLGEGGTTNMLDMFSFGKKDAEGNQYGIRASSFNPFNDLGNLFTLQGWMGATSPVISTALQMGGVDTQSGGPELYPTLRYDTETGRLTAENKNVVSNLFFNTLPHAQLVSNLMGANAEFRRLMQTDPQAAQRMLLSNAGLPVLTPSINPFEKSYNKGQKYIKAEMKRQEVNKKMISEYLKKGKLDQLVELGIPVEQIQNLKEQVANGEYNPNVVRERLNQT
jgi:anti-sigma28 factor (negative regulator of flagellin synthesis)